MAVNVLILRTAGTQCDEETAFAFRLAGAQTQKHHVNVLRAHPETLHRFDVLAIPGGFSYGDDLGAGTVQANEMLALLRGALDEFIDAGKLVIGICNGFQVLVKTGLLPGLERWKQDTTLTVNDCGSFQDRWVHLKAPANRCVLVEDGETLYTPIAHGEGKFVPACDDVLATLRDNGQIVWQYTDPQGRLGAGFPWNPNGAVADIAGICDPTGRVLGMMPHPERHCLPIHHPRWTREGLKERGEGLRLFERAVEYAGAKVGA